MGVRILPFPPNLNMNRRQFLTSLFCFSPLAIPDHGNRVEKWNKHCADLKTYVHELTNVREFLAADLDRGLHTIGVQTIGSTRRADLALKSAKKSWKQFKDTIIY